MNTCHWYNIWSEAFDQGTWEVVPVAENVLRRRVHPFFAENGDVEVSKRLQEHEASHEYLERRHEHLEHQRPDWSAGREDTFIYLFIITFFFL